MLQQRAISPTIPSNNPHYRSVNHIGVFVHIKTNNCLLLSISYALHKRVETHGNQNLHN